MATEPEIRVRFPALSDFLRSSESGMRPIQPREYTEELLGRKSKGSGQKSRDYSRKESVTLATWHPLSESVGISFADKWRSLGRYSSLPD
jgi:hypothetical protein